jgi:protein TonB
MLPKQQIIKSRQLVDFPVSKKDNSSVDWLYKTPPPEELRNLPEWLVPWGASLFAHMLLFAGLVFLFERPGDIVWVDLLETRLIPPRNTQTNETVTPPAKAPINPKPPVESPPLPRTPAIRPTQPVEQIPADPAALPAADSPLPTSPAPESVARTSRVSLVPTTTASAPPAAAPAPVETAERRYLREQYDYIRDHVTSRLHYPAMARRQGLVGQVTVTFLVQPDGRVESLDVVRSSGHQSLDRQAMQAVLAAAPFPAPPAPAVITLPVTFTLESARL